MKQCWAGCVWCEIQKSFEAIRRSALLIKFSSIFSAPTSSAGMMTEDFQNGISGRKSIDCVEVEFKAFRGLVKIIQLKYYVSF